MKKVTDQAQNIVEQAQTQEVQYQYQAQCKKVEAPEAQVTTLTQAANKSININNMKVWRIRPQPPRITS